MTTSRIDLHSKTISRGTSRRRFLTWTAVVGAAAFTPAMLGNSASAQSLGSGSLGALAGSSDLNNLGELFRLGVASGDPAPDSVALWTRLVPAPLEVGGGMPAVVVPVKWEVAEDARFSTIVRQGTVYARPQDAHSVHVTANGLQPWYQYFYRFIVGDQTSPVGRTRTTPAIGAALPALSFALASCQSWADGHYTAYEDMTASEPDVVFHVGDYIYEGAISSSAVRDLSALGAQVRKETEVLDDYRLRYGLYKSEKPLQSAHAVAPWVHTWDDHEVDNNWASEISQDIGADPAAFLARRAEAFKAWWEHTPTRLAAPSGPDYPIYRRINYGDLATFAVLDTRQYRSDQLYGDKSHVLDAATADPARTITGAAQEKWILDGFAASRSRWNVLAHQTVITDLPQIVDGERQVSMDQWSGYEASRHRILNGAAQRGTRNVMSIVGDIHRNVVSELRRDYRDPEAKAVGVEVAGTSITSGKDGKDSDATNEQYLANNPAVKAGNAQRGYVRTRVTPSEWVSELRVTEKVTEPGHALKTRYTVTVPDGRPEIQLS